MTQLDTMYMYVASWHDSNFYSSTCHFLMTVVSPVIVELLLEVFLHVINIIIMDLKYRNYTGYINIIIMDLKYRNYTGYIGFVNISS